MTPEQDALGRVLRALERPGIPDMVTGSLASSFHGRPRLTHDADVVIDPTREQLDDAAGVLAVNPALDRDYVRRWAGELGVLDLWQEITTTRR